MAVQAGSQYRGMAVQAGLQCRRDSNAGVGVSESFSSCFSFADLQNVDCLGELTGAPRAAAELIEDLPYLEPMPLSLS